MPPRTRTPPFRDGGWDGEEYEDTVATTSLRRPTLAELAEGVPRILLIEPRRRNPGTEGSVQCEDCGAWTDPPLIRIRSRGWEGLVCLLCKVEAEALGAEVEVLA